MAHAPTPLVAILDDEPRLVSTISRLLGGVGFRTCGLTSPEAAIALVACGGFDVVVTDYRMPGLTGADVCRAVRERLGDAAPPFVLVTGSLREVTSSERALFAAALEKPFERDALIAALSRSLRARRGEDVGAPSSSGVRARVEPGNAVSATHARSTGRARRA